MVKVFNSPLLIAALAALVATNARGASADPTAAESIRALAEAETESPEVIDWRTYYGVPERRALKEDAAELSRLWFPRWTDDLRRDDSEERAKEATRALTEDAAETPDASDCFIFKYGQKRRALKETAEQMNVLVGAMKNSLGLLLRDGATEEERARATRALKEDVEQAIPPYLWWNLALKGDDSTKGESIRALVADATESDRMLQQAITEEAQAQEALAARALVEDAADVPVRRLRQAEAQMNPLRFFFFR